MGTRWRRRRRRRHPGPHPRHAAPAGVGGHPPVARRLVVHRRAQAAEAHHLTAGHAQRPAAIGGAGRRGVLVQHQVVGRAVVDRRGRPDCRRPTARRRTRRTRCTRCGRRRRRTSRCRRSPPARTLAADRRRSESGPTAPSTHETTSAAAFPTTPLCPSTLRRCVVPERYRPAARGGRHPVTRRTAACVAGPAVTGRPAGRTPAADVRLTAHRPPPAPLHPHTDAHPRRHHRARPAAARRRRRAAASPRPSTTPSHERSSAERLAQLARAVRQLDRRASVDVRDAAAISSTPASGTPARSSTACPSPGRPVTTLAQWCIP